MCKKILKPNAQKNMHRQKLDNLYNQLDVIDNFQSFEKVIDFFRKMFKTNQGNQSFRK